MDHPFNRILLATEGTEFDVGAERVAFAMAAQCGVPLWGVMPVLSNPEYETVAPELAMKADREAAAKLNALREAAATQGVSLTARARHGDEPYQEIVAEARERQADLIIIRRRGKLGFLANLLVGEIVSKVIGHAPCSVLTVPRAGQMWSRHIVLATDGSPTSERAAKVALAVAAMCALPLTVISVPIDSDSEQRRREAQQHAERAASLFSGAAIDIHTRVGSGKPHEAILAAAKDIDADLIVLGRSGAERRMFGNTAQRVIGHAEWPVLIVHSG